MTQSSPPQTMPLRFIRKQVFKMQQQEFADALGRPRVAISKYETGLHPLPYDFMCRVRALAEERGLNWDDSWFFEPPVAAAAEGVAA